jgi:hypothetical protein
MDLYREIMFGRSELTRAERELLAVVVSVATTVTTEFAHTPTTSVPRAKPNGQMRPSRTTARPTCRRVSVRSVTLRSR